MVEWLASWVDGTAKGEILSFVEASVDPDSETFIPRPERVAAFDNDGTLWVEQPVPVQAPFLLGKLVEQVRANPSLATEQPYSGIINRDQAFLDGLARQEPEIVLTFLKGVGAAWEGVTPAEYAAEVSEYLRTHQHERFGRPHTDLVYKPMMELFDLLRAYDWRVFVCSGGGRDFMRVIAEDTWGIPMENVIGSAPEYSYQEGQLVRENAMRGDVDIEMLEVADFAFVVVHDDDEREYKVTAGAERILDLGPVRGWTMVSMRDDWITIFE